MKKIIAVIIASLYLASFGAFAADTHKCPKGQKWNKKEQVCKETAKPKKHE